MSKVSSSGSVSADDDVRIVTASELEDKIRSQLISFDYVKASDLSDGCGAKFEVEVVSADFTGLPILAQHRLVHKLIEEERPFIHALTLKTKAPPKPSS